MSYEYHTIAQSVVGQYHLGLGKENEDGYQVYEDERLVVLAVGDGCSSSACAKAACDAVLDGLVEFAQDTTIWDMKTKPLKAALLNYIDKHLLAAPYEYKLLASTCALVVINRVLGKYLAFSIGDCSVVVVESDLTPALLLSPVNLFQKKQNTVFANSSLANALMKVSVGDASNIAGFVLVTDGAESLFDLEGANYLKKLSAKCVLAKDLAQSTLDSYIDNQLVPSTHDDVTVVMAVRSNDQAICGVANEYYDVPTEDTPQPTQEDALYEDTNGSESVTILEFLKVPRTAEELVFAKYCNVGEVLSYTYPLIREGLVTYSDHRFTTVEG
jgi:hypothetical protein